MTERRARYIAPTGFEMEVPASWLTLQPDTTADTDEEAIQALIAYVAARDAVEMAPSDYGAYAVEQECYERMRTMSYRVQSEREAMTDD